MADSRILPGSYVDLRPLTAEDAEITFRWRNGERARLLNKGAASIQAQAQWISSRPDNERNFIIQLKNGRPVGMVALVEIDLVNRRAEPGRFLIGEEEAVRGVPAAVEAMKLLYQLAFDELGLVRLFGTVVRENKRMLTWQKYLGMREEGMLRNHQFLDGRFHDMVVVGLLEQEYRRDALPKMNALIALAGVGIPPAPSEI